MASNYPASLDTTATLPAAGGVGANLSTFPHSALHGNANDSIIAIETELGTAPSGVSSTVKARLDLMVAPHSGVFTSWTPTLLQPGPTASLTIHHARYQRTGRMVTGHARIECGGAGTAATVVTVGGLPATAAVANLVVGSFEFQDQSVPAKVVGCVYLGTTTTLEFRITANVAENRLGLAPGTLSGVALAAGDDMIFDFHYEAASD